MYAGASGPTMKSKSSTDTAGFHDRRLSMAAVRNHPLLAEPDVLQALGGGEVFLSPYQAVEALKPPTVRPYSI